MRSRYLGALPVGVLLALLASVEAPAQDGNGARRAIDASQQAAGVAVQSQGRIDRLDDQARTMLEQYRAASWEAQQLTVYADQLEELVAAQSSERDSIRRQIDSLARTEQELLPLMLRTIDQLARFIELDLPFLPEERAQRLESLRQLMRDPKASNSDRLRRILEALQIELEYGRGLGAERRQIGERSYDVLRLGRVALYALSADGTEALRWDSASADWQPLAHRHLNRIRQGLRMAREVAAPDLLELPVLVPGAGS